MYNLNEWHSVVRDTTAPTLTVDSGLRPKLFFGTELFIYNMTAMDDGQDISSNLQVITEGMLKSHVEGTATHTFSVLDSGGNEATLTTEVDVLGTWVQQTPVVHDFLTATELPSNLTPDNDTTYEFNENGLQFTGDRPPSPYWNLIHQMNANGAGQFTLKGEGAGMTFRYANVDNFGWAVFLGGTIEIRERVNGDWTSRGSVSIENYSAETEYIFGLEVEDDIATIYLDGQPLGEIKVYDNLYNTGWGIWSNSGSVTFSKAMFAKPKQINFGVYTVPSQPPTANAGPDQSVAAGARVILDSSLSSDPDGTIVARGWVQVAGDDVVLDDPNAIRPEFIAPSKAEAQRISFDLVVIDDDDQASESSTVHIDVAAVEQNNVLNIIDKLNFTLDNDGTVTAYPGRANRETFRFKPSSAENLILDEEGYLDLSKNDIRRIEASIVERGSVQVISSETDAIIIDVSRAHCRLGDLDVSSTTKAFDLTFTIYVGNDTKGVVMVAPSQEGNVSVKYYYSTIKTIQ
jgi:hypothetical protein